MNTRGKVTPNLKARVLQLADIREDGKRYGLSNRAIETKLALEGTPLSRQGVADVLSAVAEQREREGASKGAGPVQASAGGQEQRGEGRRSVTGARVVQVPAREPGEASDATAEEVAWALDAELPELPGDSSPHVVMMWRWLSEARELAKTIRPKVISGDYPMTQFVAIGNQAINLIKELHRIIPPPPPDPEKDPQNIAAREMIHGHVLSTISAIESRMAGP